MFIRLVWGWRVENVAIEPRDFKRVSPIGPSESEKLVHKWFGLKTSDCYMQIISIFTWKKLALTLYIELLF